MNKKLKGEGRLGEGEGRGRGRGGVEGEEEGEREREMKRGKGGDGRKRSQRTHPLFVYKLVNSSFTPCKLPWGFKPPKNDAGISNKNLTVEISPAKQFSLMEMTIAHLPRMQ